MLETPFSSTCAACTAPRCRVRSLPCRHPAAVWRSAPSAGVRRIATKTRAYCDTPTYQRVLLSLGAQFGRPGDRRKQPDTTTVVSPDFISVG